MVNDHHQHHPRRAEVMRLEQSNPDSMSLAEAYFHYAEVLKDQGELDGAELYFHKARDIYEHKAQEHHHSSSQSNGNADLMEHH
jgi:hypothetical protein